MIKLCKKFYIHPLFILLIVFCYITRQLELLFVSYLIMLIHELAHLIAAKQLGLSCAYIAVYPFGLNLKLNNTMLCGIADEMILYFAGPASNILMALAAVPFIGKNIYMYDFYCKNIALFAINLLPLVPLDGGMIFKKLMIYKLGFDSGCRAVRAVSCVFIVLLSGVAVYLTYMNKFNPSVCIFAAFVLGNVFVSKEKYNTSLVKELLYCKKKRIGGKAYKAGVIGADKNTGYLDIAKKFNMSSNYFVVFTDGNDRVERVMSEEEIVGKLLNNKGIY